MGAEGMNMGTRFMATNEAPIHENIKNALVEGSEHSTTLVMRSMKNTERVYKNKAAEEVLAIEKEFPGDFKKIHHFRYFSRLSQKSITCSKVFENYIKSI